MPLAVAGLLQQYLQTDPHHFVESLECVVLRGAIGQRTVKGYFTAAFLSLSHTLFIVILFGAVCPRLCVGHELPPLCLCVIGILFTEEQVHNLPRTVYVSLLL